VKRSEEIIGLAIFSITEGKEIGNVQQLLVNPEGKNIDYLAVSIAGWHYGLQVIPFKLVTGIGEHAVTVEAEDVLRPLNEEAGAVRLLDRDLQIIGMKILTNKGRLIGTVSEFYVNEETGAITGCEMVDDAQQVKGIIPANFVLTLGKDVLVVSSEAENALLEDIAQLPTAQEAAVTTAPAAEGETTAETTGSMNPAPNAPSDASKLFEERQRQYMLGKTVSRQITNDQGEIIAAQGEVVTEALIDKAKAAGKFIELMTNITD